MADEGDSAEDDIGDDDDAGECIDRVDVGEDAATEVVGDNLDSFVVVGNNFCEEVEEAVAAPLTFVDLKIVSTFPKESVTVVAVAATLAVRLLAPPNEMIFPIILVLRN